MWGALENFSLPVSLTIQLFGSVPMSPYSSAATSAPPSRTKTCWLRMEVSGWCPFFPMLHLSCDLAPRLLPCTAPGGVGSHNMELTAQPGWSRQVTHHLPAEGDLAQLVLRNAAREPEPENPISLVPSFPDDSCDPDTKSQGRNCLLVPACWACWGPGPCRGWARARAGLRESVGRLCGGSSWEDCGGEISWRHCWGASPEERVEHQQ